MTVASYTIITFAELRTTVESVAVYNIRWIYSEVVFSPNVQAESENRLLSTYPFSSPYTINTQSATGVLIQFRNPPYKCR